MYTTFFITHTLATNCTMKSNKELPLPDKERDGTLRREAGFSGRNDWLVLVGTLGHFKDVESSLFLTAITTSSLMDSQAYKSTNNATTFIN